MGAGPEGSTKACEGHLALQRPDTKSGFGRWDECITYWVRANI